MTNDLEELARQCSDPRSRDYIQEAVACYRVGAYRAAIAGCWLAVLFDLVDKIREVAALGDSAAQQEVEKLERIHNSPEIKDSLAYERALPDLAFEKFEFISRSELRDLQRLVEDRNRCAHPSRVSESEIFRPTESLARMHIETSIRNILAKPPTQGQAALDRLIEDLNSRFFPSKLADVVVFMRSSALGKPRAALLRNYAMVLFKTLTSGGVQHSDRLRSTTALTALRNLHPAECDELFPELLRGAISKADDAGIGATITMLSRTDIGQKIWTLLTEVDRLRLKSWAYNMPVAQWDDFSDLDLIVADEFSQRLGSGSADDFVFTMWFEDTPGAAIERLIQLCAQRYSPSNVEKIGNQLTAALADSNNPVKHMLALVQGAGNSAHLRDSPHFSASLRNLAKRDEISAEAIGSALAANGMPDLNWTASRSA